MGNVNSNHHHIMSSLNKVMLIGRLTRDPELRHTPKGTSLAEFGLAVNRSFTTESGEKREDTTFVDVSVWGKTAETIGKYLHKGNLAYVEGRLRMETWTDKSTGQNRTKLTIVGESIQFLEPAGSARQGTYTTAKPEPRPMAAEPVSTAADDDDWDKPF